jgi:hypothetical protein
LDPASAWSFGRSQQVLLLLADGLVPPDLDAGLGQ